MAASNKPTAVHVSLVIFVMLTLVMSVVAYSFYSDYREATAKATALDTEVRNAKQELGNQIDEIKALKQVIGQNQADIGLGNVDDPSTVLGAANKEIRDYGGDLAQADYSATLSQMSNHLIGMTNERDDLKTEVEGLKTELASLRGQYQALVDEHQQAKELAERDREEIQTEREQQIKAKSEQVAALQQTNKTLQTEKEMIETESDIERRKNQRTIEQFENQNSFLASQVDEFTRPSFEEADGTITVVDHVNRTVWINIGKADRLPLRTTFSVYTQDHHGVGRGEGDIKGSIEVTKLIGPHLAEARILDDDILRPLQKGDPIYSPLWTAGSKEFFAIAGFIDFDDDGRSDRELLKQIVENQSAVIDTEVTMEGELIGEGITNNTKFFVIGQIPDPTQAASEDEGVIFNNIQNHVLALTRQARQRGVRIVKLDDFLTYMGYKPTRRLWLPGQESGYQLKKGQRQPQTDSTLWQRHSTMRRKLRDRNETPGTSVDQAYEGAKSAEGSQGNP